MPIQYEGTRYSPATRDLMQINGVLNASNGTMESAAMIQLGPNCDTQSIMLEDGRNHTTFYRCFGVTLFANDSQIYDRGGILNPLNTYKALVPGYAEITFTYVRPARRNKS